MPLSQRLLCAATATKLDGDDVATRFVAEVRKRAGGKNVIPVWTTECEDVDGPAAKNQGCPGTGLCGTVELRQGACMDVFTRQWTALAAGHSGSIGFAGVAHGVAADAKGVGRGPE